MKNKKSIILVALDFSKCSENALDYTIKSYREYNAKIVLVHAIQENYTEPSIKKLIDKDKKKTKENISKKLEDILLKKLKKTSSRCEYEIITEFGPPLETILKTIRKVKPFFVIIGAKKTIGFMQRFFRNDTIKVAKQTKFPVVIIPEDAHYKKIKRITFATNYNLSDIKSIKNLAEQAKPYNIEIIVLHISDGEFDIEFEDLMINDFNKKVSKRVHYKNISYRIIEGDNIDEIIKHYLTQKNTELFAFATCINNGRHLDLLENRVSKIIPQSPIPLMAYHYKGEKDFLYTKKIKHERAL